jgi:hypothetical protein
MTETPLPWFFWLFPLAFAVHNIEEALWLPGWSQSAGRFHKPVGAFEFRFALIVLTLFATVITSFLYSSGKQTFPSYLFFAFNFGMLLNVVVPHLAATIVLKKYCPGLLSGIFLLLPTTAALLWYGYQHKYFLFPLFWYVTVPFAALVIGSIPVLFKVGRMIKVSVKNV